MVENLEKPTEEDWASGPRNEEKERDVIDRFMSAQSEAQRSLQDNTASDKPTESHLWAPNVDLTGSYEKKSSENSGTTKESPKELQEAA